VADLSASSLFLGVLFGSVGFGFFLYGRKQRTIVPLVCGLALMVVPYLIPNAWLLSAVGLVLVAVPYFVRL
jgi:hypothetical protein